MFNRNDPLASYNFKVELNGITRAGFKECAGLESTVNAGTYREGTDATLALRSIPGLQTFTTIVLKRGITNDRALWDWHKLALDGRADRQNISIILLDDTGKNKIWWNIKCAWPTKWSGPSMDATGDNIAIETLELAHEGISVQTWE